MTRARDTADLLTLAPDSQALEPDNAMPLIHNGANDGMSKSNICF